MIPSIDTIGEAVVLAIAPFVPELLNKLGEGAIKKAGSDAYDTAKALYQEIFNKRDSAAARTALEQLASKSENKARQQVLKAELMALMHREAALAQSLAGILAAAKLLPAQQSITVNEANKSQIVQGNSNTLNQTNIDVVLPAPKPRRTGELSNVPNGSDTFVGREDKLEALHERLAQGDAVAITAIQGMGGVGKTELARQYAKQYQTAYPGGVCWLQARDLEVASQIVEFAAVYLHVEPPQDLALKAQVAYCWSHWPGAERVLVVYDDVTDYARVVEALPPQAERFRVLMTTRQRQLAVTVQPFAIDVLTEAAALELLRQIVGAERTEAELKTVREICEWVGYLPLGLELVGQYLRQRDVSFAVLLERLKAQRTEARALQDTYPGMTAERGVIAAFELSWKLVDEEAQKIACWLSLFALAPISWELAESPVTANQKEEQASTNPGLLQRIGLGLYQLIRKRAQSIPQELVELPVEAKKERWEEGRDALVNLSLLQRLGAGSYQLHQLVREYFQVKLAQRADADELKKAYCQMMVTIGQQIPDKPTRYLILRLTPAIPHIAEAATTWQSWLGSEDDELSWPFVAVARFYSGQGAYAHAEPWLKGCLVATQNHFGYEHPSIASSLGNLALLYESQGRYELAEPLFVEALDMTQKLFGNNHPNVASSFNNLAFLYESQGRYELAESLYKQALDMRKKLFGDNHFSTATSFNNLATLYCNLCRYELAEPLFVKALSLRRELLGNNHPYVSVSLNNLAELHRCQGRYELAEPLFVEALDMTRKLLGDDHPDIATIFNNLALLYRDQGNCEQAEPLFKKALDLRYRLFGNNHCDIADSLSNLAELYRRQGRYEQAKPLFVKALDLSCQLFGDDHPDVAKNENNLALIYLNEGRYEQAEPLYVHALELSRKLLGKDHLHIATVLNNLASLYFHQGRYKQAEPLYAESTSILIEQLGDDHPNTQAGMNNFVQFITAAVQAGRQRELSDHPYTQRLLASVQSQQSN